jgi:hypothetical protein
LEVVCLGAFDWLLEAVGEMGFRRNKVLVDVKVGLTLCIWLA